MKIWSTCLPIAVAIAVWLGASAARAQGTDQAASAEALFDEGMKLIDGGKIAEACPKLEASYRIDPGYGVLFNLADCHEQIGRTASAWAEFREALSMAKKSGEVEREQKAARRSAALEPRLVRLLITVKSASSGLRLTRDEAPVDQVIWGNAVPVDPGPHMLKAVAPGKTPWSTTVDVSGEGKVVTVEVPALADEALAPASHGSKVAPASVTRSGGLSTQRTLALVFGGVGVAGIVVGTIFGVRAKAQWDGAQANHCPDKYHCDPDGIRMTNDAYSAAGVATATFIVGGAAATGAAILWFTAPSRSAAARSGPVICVGSGGLLVSGRF